MFRKRFIEHRLSLLVNVIITLTVAVVHWQGWLAGLEWAMYDRLVRYCSHVPADDRIVHIDVDDAAIARGGAWPWSRDRDGEIVQILHELGAERIVLDFLWTERKPPELRTPALEPYAELEGAIPLMGELSADNFVSPDDELAHHLRNSGPIYLALFGTAIEPNESNRPSESPQIMQMAELLRRDFSLSDRDVAKQLGQSISAIEPYFARIKRQVANELVAEQFKRSATSQPSSQNLLLLKNLPSPRAIHESLLKTPFDRPTKDREDLLAAYDRQLGLQNLQVRCEPMPAGLKGKLPIIQELTPPLYKLTAGAAIADTNAPGVRVGFANRSEADGMMLRSIPLLFEWNDLLVEQLGFRVARESLGVFADDLSIDADGNLCIRSNPRSNLGKIQLDRSGQMLINWHITAGDWQQCFNHVPMMPILCIWEARQRIQQNDRLRLARLHEVARAVKDDVGYGDYRTQVHRMLELQQKIRAVQLEGKSKSEKDKGHETIRRMGQELQQIKQQLQQEDVLIADLVRHTWAQLAKEPDPNDATIADDYRRFHEANRILTEVIPEIDATNDRIAQETQQLTEKIRPLIAGKTCFVGYTATAIADMVHTPAYHQLPGAMVHSQIFNNLTSGHILSTASRNTQILVLLAFGAIVTLIATALGPRTSLVIVLTLMIGSLAFNATVLFGTFNYWLPIATALLLSPILWAMTVLVRYLVIDRQRRWFSRAVARYVSPAMAQHIGESAEKCSFEPTATQITCFFSDLTGFTTMSERLGPQGTRAILNPYLESMSAVLHRHQALINKFMGDGIFAFFNPPILPCHHHAKAACHAAIDCRQALAELAARFAGTPMESWFHQLHMRVGIATGAAFVGDYGSEDKLDYTCMGDVVNLASRLESANKQFGTSILVAGTTRDATAAEKTFAFRRLGMLQVRGQTRNVAVYELLGRHNEVGHDELAYAEQFDRAVSAFCRRDWATATAEFNACILQRPSDRTALRYLELIAVYQSAKLADDWLGTLELIDK